MGGVVMLSTGLHTFGCYCLGNYIHYQNCLSGQEYLNAKTH
jgi:hypothetical protein